MAIRLTINRYTYSTRAQSTIRISCLYSMLSVLAVCTLCSVSLLTVLSFSFPPPAPHCPSCAWVQPVQVHSPPHLHLIVLQCPDGCCQYKYFPPHLHLIVLHVLQCPGGCCQYKQVQLTPHIPCKPRYEVEVCTMTGWRTSTQSCDERLAVVVGCFLGWEATGTDIPAHFTIHDGQST